MADSILRHWLDALYKSQEMVKGELSLVERCWLSARIVALGVY